MPSLRHAFAHLFISLHQLLLLSQSALYISIFTNGWSCEFFATSFQVGSTTLHRDDQDQPVLLVSQPGGVFLRVRVPEGRPFDDPADDDGDQVCRTIRAFEPLVVSHNRNSNVTTEILGGFSTATAAEDNQVTTAPFWVSWGWGCMLWPCVP